MKIYNELTTLLESGVYVEVDTSAKAIALHIVKCEDEWDNFLKSDEAIEQLPRFIEDHELEIILDDYSIQTFESEVV